MAPAPDAHGSGERTSPPASRGVPRWLRVLLVVAAVVLAAAIALLLIGGHGPGRHVGLEAPRLDPATPGRVSW